MGETIKKIEEHDEQLDIIAQTVADHTMHFERMEENMVTKVDHQQVINTLDQILMLTKKKDEELI